MISNRNKSLRDFDWILLLTVFALCVYGLIILSSAANTLDNYRSVMRSQTIATILGLQ